MRQSTLQIISVPVWSWTSRRVWFAAGAAALCGLAWSAPWQWLGPGLSLLLIPLVLAQRTRLRRYGVALAYYLAGSHGIPLASAVFFGYGSTGKGIVLWLASSALLAAGWAFADRPWKAVTVLAFDALVPPLSFFDWMSPLTAAGVFFPGWSWAGLALLLAVVLATPFLLRHKGILGILAALSLVLNALYVPASLPQGWGGIDLHVGPSHKSILANFERMQSWVATAGRQKAKILLLPETLLTWWSGSADFVQRHVPKGAIWLVGATVPLPGGYYADGIEEVTPYGYRRLFASALPVPVSMWMPWRTPEEGRNNLHLLHVPSWMIPDQYRAFWWSPVQTIDGQSVWANICYDQLLPLIWLEGVIQGPHVVLLTNNEWWAHGTGIPKIQAASSWAWTSLIGAQTLEAENK